MIRNYSSRHTKSTKDIVMEKLEYIFLVGFTIGLVLTHLEN